MSIAIPHKTVCFFSDYFTEQLRCLPSIYEWKVPQIDGFNASAETKLQGMGADSLSNFEENILLKHFMNREWHSTECGENRIKRANDIVSKWGGIRTNDPKTLRNHIQLANNPNPMTPIKGIASYSKILSIVDLNRYAIYDARVAACLNAIQFTGNVKEPVFFSYVPSRNSIIGGNKTSPGFLRFSDFKRRKLVGSGWSNVQRNQTYAAYLELLRKCSETLETPIYHLEMVLFSRAVTECVHAIQAISPDYVPPKGPRRYSEL